MRHASTLHLADAGTTVLLCYKASPEPERRLRPRLMSGEYGHYLVHDDLIIFQANRPRPDSHDNQFDPGIFAAKNGPPATEVTGAILLAAAKHGIPTSGVFIRETYFETSDSGVRVSLLRWTGPGEPDKSNLERKDFILPWQEIAAMIDGSRSRGVRHKFRGVEYYAEQ